MYGDDDDDDFELDDDDDFELEDDGPEGPIPDPMDPVWEPAAHAVVLVQQSRDSRPDLEPELDDLFLRALAAQGFLIADRRLYYYPPATEAEVLQRLKEVVFVLTELAELTREPQVRH